VRQQDAYPANAGSSTTVCNTSPPFKGQHLSRWLYASSSLFNTIARTNQ